MKAISPSRRKILAQAIAVLCAFYEKNKKKDILGIYLWGSITTDDFDAKKSDIDSIAFVGEDVAIEDEVKAIRAISRQLPGLSMRFLYPSEMKGGKPRGNLAKVADYRLLAIDLLHWRHIAGKVVRTEDFGLKPITRNEAIRLTLRQIFKRNLIEIKHQEGKEKYFIKAMMRLCFYIQQKGGVSGPFSYSRVKATANRETKSVVDILFGIKRGGYDRKVLSDYLPTLLIFLEKSKRNYGMSWPNNRRPQRSKR